MAYAYFPGCSLHGLAAEYDRSARAVFERLGVALQEAPNWVCCGATPAHATSPLLAVALPAVSLAETWKARDRLGEGPPTMVAACAACYHRLRTANYELRQDPALRAQVRQAAEVEYEGQVDVRHLLDVLYRELGADAIGRQVARPLTNLKVACYYGCLLNRPPAVVAFDDPEDPRVMDDLLAAAGATCVDWPYKTECCGASFALARPDVVSKLSGDILREAKEAGADLIAVACPLCQNNLDLLQADAEKAGGTRFDLPVLYFTQLLGLALGLDSRVLGLERLIVSPFAAIGHQ